ncbi:MAG: hypothetical protein QME74_02900 [Candidatus Edwardsbacteria bacterium]|nr:hypothetical protein [Candidatus Edwardsbacteria bacterium]
MKLLDFIICDDIRFEVGNKNTLVGIYGDINLTQKRGSKLSWPVPLKLWLYLRCLINEGEDKPESFHIDITHNTKGSIAPIAGTLSIPEGIKYLNLALVGNISLPDTGVISFKISFFKAGQEVYVVVPDYTFSIHVIDVD